MKVQRRLPIGAEVQADGTSHFRVWARNRQRVEVVVETGARSTTRLEPEGNGYFAGVAPAAARDRYRFRVDGQGPFPDPASRFQPDGPHGPSAVVDPSAYCWNDRDWRGIERDGQVVYEMHVGTFTAEGTYEAAERELPELAAAGITVLELMPVADFPGKFGWGYDGVNLFAPTRLYGGPDDLRHFVDRAHAVGLGVILDVVYNHFGPDGNYLKTFADEYFTARYANEWGEEINFDGEHSASVREYFVANAGYWIDEFHMDGLRLDATQQIFDASPVHVMAEISQRVRAAAQGRATFLVAENEPQETRLVRPVERGGFGLDALWNDDFHHSATVALTGRKEAYYSDYAGNPQEFISSAKYGYLFQGQWYSWQQKRRGSPALDLPPGAFVAYIENHDQVANSARGLRRHFLTSPAQFRAMTALLLLGPWTPMLFQGQEFAASSPFFYFADHEKELARKVCEGRQQFLSQFGSMASPGMAACIPNPSDPTTFTRSKLDFTDRERNAPHYQLTKDLLALRRSEPIFRAPRVRGVDGAVLGPEAFVLRFFDDAGSDRLLLMNLGRDLRLTEAPEPLLAPPANKGWEIQWSSEDPKYGGNGTAPLETVENWRIPATTAVLLRPGQPREPAAIIRGAQPAAPDGANQHQRAREDRA